MFEPKRDKIDGKDKDMENEADIKDRSGSFLINKKNRETYQRYDPDSD